MQTQSDHTETAKLKLQAIADDLSAAGLSVRLHLSVEGDSGYYTAYSTEIDKKDRWRPSDYWEASDC